MKRIRILTSLLMLMLASLVYVPAACMAAETGSAYEGIEVMIPVSGTGTFRLFQKGAEDADALEEIQINGRGAFRQQYIEPDNYEYVIMGTGSVNTAVYTAKVAIMVGDDGKLKSYVKISDQERPKPKLTAALYPVSVTPVVEKRISGDAPARSSSFEFIFSAVSTTAEGMEWTLPMPEGTDGQKKAIRITGSGSQEIGTIFFDREGDYIYEITEIDTGEAGYTYDKSTYRITYTVKDTENGLVIKTSMKKKEKNVWTKAAGISAVFTNTYKGSREKPAPTPTVTPKPTTPTPTPTATPKPTTTPRSSSTGSSGSSGKSSSSSSSGSSGSSTASSVGNPSTGDMTEFIPWAAMCLGSIMAISALILYIRRRKARQNP